MADNHNFDQTLAALGATTAEQVASNFAQVRARFDEQAGANSSDVAQWNAFLVAWTGRKSGVLTKITDNWLKPATPELKRAVGQKLNQLKAHIDGVVKEKQAAIEAAAEQAAAARDQIDLSLPGIEHTIGSRHLIRQTY